MQDVFEPANSTIEPAKNYGEAGRPAIHFTPKKNWINDPNGMFYYGGIYHLFYQYNPTDSVWGDIHWGHAISRDLVSWQELAPALQPDNEGLGMVFSGGAVVDLKNTSGMKHGEHPPIFLFFTHSNTQGQQQQSMAYSLDGASSWTMWPQNPILPNTEIKDYRDPKVSWCEARQHWVMALAVGHQIWFYTSKNLVNWSKASEFGEGIGAHGGVWECPDLFELTDDIGNKKWVLLVSLNPGGPNKGSATQYFIGEFDGETFISDDDVIRWLDFGPDNYAAVSWDNTPGQRLIVGWMNNWNYANFTPSAPWRGSMTLPRKLSLINDGMGYSVVNFPVDNLSVLAKKSIPFSNDISNFVATLNDSNDKAWHLQMELEWLSSNAQFSFSLKSKNIQNNEFVELIVSAATSSLVFDRSHTNLPVLKPELIDGFNVRAIAPVEFIDNRILLDIWIDQSSMEVFVNGGRSVMTAQFFAKETLSQFSFELDESKVKCIAMTCKPLDSIWNR